MYVHVPIPVSVMIPVLPTSPFTRIYCPQLHIPSLPPPSATHLSRLVPERKITTSPLHPTTHPRIVEPPSAGACITTHTLRAALRGFNGGDAERLGEAGTRWMDKALTARSTHRGINNESRTAIAPPPPLSSPLHKRKPANGEPLRTVGAGLHQAFVELFEQAARLPISASSTCGSASGEPRRHRPARDNVISEAERRKERMAVADGCSRDRRCSAYVQLVVGFYV